MGCEPSRIFHGRFPYNKLDHKLGLNPNPKELPTTDFADAFKQRTQTLIEATKKNVMQSYLKYKENFDREAKAALLQQNDYCFNLQPIADHQGSKIPFQEYRLSGPYVVEIVLPNQNYIVRKLNSNKAQLLHRIRLRKHEPKTVLQGIRPESVLQPGDEVSITQDDLYVITWETNLGDFPNSTEEMTIPTRRGDADTTNSLGDDVNAPGEIFTDVDLRSAESHENGNFESPKKVRSERTNDWLDDQQSSGGSDNIVPEVSDEENDDVIVENESLRGGKNNLRLNPTTNITDEYRY